jgi:hypothetical protein
VRLQLTRKAAAKITTPPRDGASRNYKPVGIVEGVRSNISDYWPLQTIAIKIITLALEDLLVPYPSVPMA